MTGVTEIEGWVEEGKKRGATHVVIVCDKFNYEDFPVYVMPGEEVRAVINTHSTDSEKVMECYKMSLNIQTQLLERRAYNL